MSNNMHRHWHSARHAGGLRPLRPEAK